MRLSASFKQYADDVRTRLRSVYAAQNECHMTGLETPIHAIPMPNGNHIKVYRDNFGKHRIVIHKTDAHRVGYSGILIDETGTVEYKETCKLERGRNTTRQLQIVLTMLDIEWHPSQWQTEAGAACYKE